MTQPANPYVVWMRDRTGELTPAEEVVVASLPELAYALAAAEAGALAWWREACAIAAPGAEVPEDGSDAVRGLLFEGACHELSRIASSPERAAFFSRALAYAGAESPPSDLPGPPAEAPGHEQAAAHFDAWCGERLAAAADGMGAHLLHCGALTVRRVLYGEGAPDPAAGPDEPRPGRFFQRAMAWLGDAAVVVLAGGAAQLAATLLFGIADEGTLTVVTLGAAAVALVAGGVMLGRTGRTPGCWAAGLEVVSHEHGGPLGAGRGVLRQTVGQFVNQMFYGLGIYQAWRHRERRTWGDKLSGAIVVQSAPALRVQRRWQLALVMSVVVSVAAAVVLNERSQVTEGEGAELTAVLTRANEQWGRMNLLASRSVPDEAAYRSDLTELLGVCASFDSTAREARGHFHRWNRKLLVGLPLRARFATLDTLYAIRVEQARLWRAWALAGLEAGPAAQPVSPARKRMRFLRSDIEALDRRAEPVSERAFPEPRRGHS